MNQHRSMFDSATLRLTAWYMVILMIISLVFSGILYKVASDEFDRAFGPRGGNYRLFVVGDSVDDLREQFIRESNQRLVANLFAFNIFVLVAGGGVSYILARRTMEPIEQALEAQSRFSSDAAHELRTPLAVMQSEIEVGLRDKSATKTSQKRILESSLDEVNRMRTLTDRLLLLAQHHHIETTSVQLEDVAVEVLNRAIPLASSKQIQIENNISSFMVQADKESLVDVLHIFVENAIKYSPDKSTITLTAEQQAKRVLVHVADQGEGISQADQAKIFDRFYRADISRSKQNVEGYGLGLSIAKQLIELQQGSIQLTSELTKGSTFTIILPVAHTD